MDWISIEKKTQHFKTGIDHELNDEMSKVENISGLKTSLFPHQKTIIKAMTDLERNRKFTLTESRVSTICKKFNLSTSAGILSEAVGSGKTIDLLCVILIQKIPKIFPDISELQMVSINKQNYTPNYVCTIRKKFRNILTPTIIFVGVGVINQWINSIKTFTVLTYFVVYGVKELQILINKMDDKSINSFDIILVKNGKVTRPINFPKYVKVENRNVCKSVLHIYNIIANMGSFCWARVIVDDFDTIKLPHNAGIVNGLFTWYVSSTRKKMNSYASNTNLYKNTSDLLLYNNYNCGNIMNNKILFDHFNIKNETEFVESTNMISTPNFYIYTFTNLDNQYMGLLSLMNDTEANEIMEMLNGDAVETAAERLGIKTNKVADIFQNMLGKQFEKYAKSKNVLEFIQVIYEKEDERSPMSDNPNPDDTYKKSDLFIKREVLYNYPNLKSLLESTHEEYEIIYKKSSISIERVKNNVKNGECAICSNDLDDEDEDTIILKCCGNIVCGICCFGTIFPKKSKVGQCSNCRAKLFMPSLIFLNSGFDLNKIIEEKIEEIPNPVEEKVCAPRDKLTAILEIIQGNVPVERKLVDINIANLMKGTHTLPDATYNKVLIFANYDETLKKIKDTLSNEKIEFWQLNGSYSNIAKIVENFTNCDKTCVLIINSMNHCSGLNLQSATDLIFMHKILDTNIETQVIGRGQRLGRVNMLNVHYMLYENEYTYMVRNNTIRVID
jgi:hypothetical protein